MTILSEILGSRVRAELFRVLFGLRNDELHMRELERRTGFAIRTVQSELKKLSQLELVKQRRDGNRLYYSANLSHPLYPDIHNLVLRTNGLVSVLQEALLRDPSIQLAFVFGSVAKQQLRAESDVDLMIIGGLGLREVTGLLSGVAELIGREINPIVMGSDEFVQRKRSGEHFISQVIDEPKIFIIGNENDLTKLG